MAVMASPGHLGQAGEAWVVPVAQAIQEIREARGGIRLRPSGSSDTCPYIMRETTYGRANEMRT